MTVMASDLPVDHVEALRTHLTRYRPSKGFELVDVYEDGDLVAVVFRWNKDPSSYLVRVDPRYVGPFAAAAGGPTDERLQGWAEDLQLWFMEELDTGFVARADRSREGDVVVLTPHRDVEEDREPAWYVTDVPQFAPEWVMPRRLRLRMALRSAWARLRGRPATLGWTAWGPVDEVPGDGARDGCDLADAGMDAAAVRALRDDAGLVAWLKVIESATLDALAHCAIVTTQDPAVFRVAILQSSATAPDGVHAALVSAAVRAAADEGARTLLVPGDDGLLESIDTVGC